MRSKHITIGGGTCSRRWCWLLRANWCIGRRMGLRCRNNKSKRCIAQTIASMIPISLLPDKNDLFPAKDRSSIECNDIDDSSPYHLPARVCVREKEREDITQLAYAFVHTVGPSLTFVQTDMSDSMNLQSRMSPSHLVLFLSKKFMLHSVPFRQLCSRVYL